MANSSTPKVFSVFILSCVLIGPVAAQFDAALIVSALSTGLSLIRHIMSLWNAAFQEKQGDHIGSGIGGDIFNIPGPIPDLDFDFNSLKNLSWMGNSSSTLGTGFTAFLASRLKSDRALLSQFASISVKLTGLDTRVGNIELALARLANQLPSLIQWEIGFDRLMATMRPIHSLYDTFRYNILQSQFIG
jgi:hypothetical protein